MRELCKIHGLVLAPDGKCILCRRQQASLFALSAEQESLVSKVVTALLGAGLLAAAAAFIYASQLPAGYTGVRQKGRALVREPAEPAEPGPAAPDAGAAPVKPKAAARGAIRVKEVAPPTYADVQVTMYAAPWCSICDRTRDFLLARDVILVEHDIERDKDAARQLAKLNPLQSLPTLQIAGRVQVGFNPWPLEDALRAAARERARAAGERPASIRERPAAAPPAR